MVSPRATSGTAMMLRVTNLVLSSAALKKRGSLLQSGTSRLWPLSATAPAMPWPRGTRMVFILSAASPVATSNSRSPVSRSFSRIELASARRVRAASSITTFSRRLISSVEPTMAPAELRASRRRISSACTWKSLAFSTTTPICPTRPSRAHRSSTVKGGRPAGCSTSTTPSRPRLPFTGTASRAWGAMPTCLAMLPVNRWSLLAFSVRALWPFLATHPAIPSPTATVRAFNWALAGPRTHWKRRVWPSSSIIRMLPWSARVVRSTTSMKSSSISSRLTSPDETRATSCMTWSLAVCMSSFCSAIISRPSRSASLGGTATTGRPPRGALGLA